MNELYLQYCEALKGEQAPSLFLDLAAFEFNMDWMLKNAGQKKIRIATKSIRSVEILRMILAYSPTFQGLMTYTLEEALWLRELGFKDILMGYPTTDNKSLEILARDPQGITLMVDLPEHLDHLSTFSPVGKFSVCIDLDLSMDLPGLRFGVHRSAVGNKISLLKLLERFKHAPKVKLSGLMGYEAQIAGLGDKESFIIRFLKKLSIKQLRVRRSDIVTAIRERGHEISLINGGGTGSLLSTREESCVTEVTIGSGFYAPHLFDHYQDFSLKPALAYTLPIVRKPATGLITCLGGGYIASGSIDQTRAPSPYLPVGLELLKLEGAGEVQTPLRNTHLYPLDIGDVVIMRHAKAGEPCERFNEIKLIKSGRIQGLANTYRGAGKCFL